jgi:hypothetical protein
VQLFCGVTGEYENLLKIKLIDLNILCENDTMATGGEVNFPKTLPLPNSKGIENWDNSLPIFLFLLFFPSIPPFA